ncbi:MAG: hypothetical protein ACYSUI_22690 [Planctomycetota bacterium]|jgi:hypothetical protein
MDSKNLAIGVLSTTAVILLTALILVQTRPEPAYAFGMNAQGGDYLLTTGQMQPAQELLYVIDAAHERMVVYQFDINRRQINMGRSVNLERMRERAASSADRPKGGSGKGRRGRGRGR